MSFDSLYSLQGISLTSEIEKFNQSISKLGFQNGEEINKPSSYIPFADIFAEALQNVNEADAAVRSDTIALATGDTDALHRLTIDSTKRQLAVSLLVSMRDKALQSYDTIMRMQI